MAAPPGADPLITDSLAKVKLSIKTDGSFRLVESTFDKEGIGSLGAKTGTLHIDRIMERPVGSLGPEGAKMAGDRQVVLNPDGTMNLTVLGGGTVVLQRASAQ